MIIVDTRTLAPSTIIPQGFKLTPFTRYAPPIILFVCFYCYYVATSRGEVNPFPSCTITMTATPYPQNILFRYVMSAFGVLALIIWTTAYYVLESYSKIYANGQVTVPCTIHWFSLVGFVLFEITINTIDSGKMDDALHTVCAVLFFVLWTFTMILITYGYWRLSKYYSEIITKKSLTAKIVIVTLAIALIIEELLHSIKVQRLEMDPEVPIIEWGIMIYLAAFVYTFTWDWQNFQFVLDTNYVPTEQVTAPRVVAGQPATPSTTQPMYIGVPTVQYTTQPVVVGAPIQLQ